MNNNIAIGWDIGIKNLSFCILEKVEKNTNNNADNNNNNNENYLKIGDKIFIIKHWQCISLMEQIDKNKQQNGELINIKNNILCKNIIKNNKQCLKKAIYCETKTILKNDEYEYTGYCKIHYNTKCNELKNISTLDNILNNNDNTYANNTILPTEDNKLIDMKNTLCNGKDCKNKHIYVLKTNIFIGYCKKHYYNLIKNNTNTQQDFLKKNNVKNSIKIDLQTLSISLIQELNKINNIINQPNIILLENQPVLKNPTMKSIQMFLYSYYIINNIDTIANKKIMCYIASKKLDIIKYLSSTDQTEITNKLSNITNKYQKNKKMSIYIVEKLLHNSPWLATFSKNSKQDDLADSLLMTLHHLLK